MAFVIEQKFDQVEHRYDRDGDVLYLSFGPPVPAIGLAVEDWLVVRITPGVPQICGVTIVGFKRLFGGIRPDLAKDLEARVDRLKKAHFVARYADETDTLTFRMEEEQPAYYERFEQDIFLERALVGGQIIGVKLTHYTECGSASIEKLLSSMLDALFASPGTDSGSADALTKAFLRHLDIPRLLSLAA